MSQLRPSTAIQWPTHKRKAAKRKRLRRNPIHFISTNPNGSN